MGSVKHVKSFLFTFLYFSIIIVLKVSVKSFYFLTPGIRQVKNIFEQRFYEG